MRRTLRAAPLAALVVAAVALSPLAAGEEVKRGSADVTAEVAASGLAQPVYTAVAPGVSDLVYVAELGGTVQAVDPSTGSKQEFLDISAQVTTAGGSGFTGIAFHPDYAQNHLFYVYYTTDESHLIRLDEFEATSDTAADPASQRNVLEIPHPDSTVHYGGTIAFGPDGFLYAAIGDGGPGGDPKEKAQDRSSLLGKLIRIDPAEAGADAYSIPPDNPFVERPGRDQIYALGLRNPFRFSFDPATGRIAIGDVGQASWEEVDIESERSLRGANFGWDHFEGDHVFRWDSDNEAPAPPRSSYEPPVHEYSHDRGMSVTGGIVVHDAELPALDGRYLYADFISGKLRSFEVDLRGAKDDRRVGLKLSGPTSFAAGPQGGVFVTSLFDGTLMRLAQAP